MLRLTFETNGELIVERESLLAQREQLVQLKANRLPSITANISGTNSWDMDSKSRTSSYSASISADYILYDGNLRWYYNYKPASKTVRAVSGSYTKCSIAA